MLVLVISLLVLFILAQPRLHRWFAKWERKCLHREHAQIGLRIATLKAARVLCPFGQVLLTQCNQAWQEADYEQRKPNPDLSKLSQLLGSTHSTLASLEGPAQAKARLAAESQLKQANDHLAHAYSHTVMDDKLNPAATALWQAGRAIKHNDYLTALVHINDANRMLEDIAPASENNLVSVIFGSPEALQGLRFGMRPR